MTWQLYQVTDVGFSHGLWVISAQTPNIGRRFQFSFTDVSVVYRSAFTQIFPRSQPMRESSLYAPSHPKAWNLLKLSSYKPIRTPVGKIDNWMILIMKIIPRNSEKEFPSIIKYLLRDAVVIKCVCLRNKMIETNRKFVVVGSFNA
jgi:hypothetical protein